LPEPAPNRPGPSYARNQGFYGFLAGEWHGNHHLHPRSARAGHGPWQPDLAFAIIRLMRRLGIVASYREEVPGAQ
jgi:stearoyl-CoA desaturase (delta-9 desaturase)